MFTRQYFHAEVLNFRKAFGNKVEWKTPGRLDKMLQGLTYCYLKTDGITESDRDLFVATCDEYTRRTVHVMFSPINYGE